MPPLPNCSLPLCEVLEQEYCALTGAAPPRVPDVELVPEQILDPLALARRLLHGTDSVAAMLRQELLKDTVAELAEPQRAGDIPSLRRVLGAGLNRLLTDARLFDCQRRPGFDGVRFRSQTADRIEDIHDPMRNRLILEDAFPEIQKLFDIRLATVYRKIHRQQLRALCLSGGGIRSASFGLGLIQGLARTGLLDQFEYLSTVSGGGYIGGWLSAWIARTSLGQVIAQLRQRPRGPLDPESAPIEHLRSYSNYLTPRLGVLSADAWTLGATYIRNLFLNWLALLPPLVAILSIPLVLVQVVNWQPVGAGVTLQYVIGLVLAGVAVACSVAAVRYVHVNRPSQRHHTEGTGLYDEKRSQRDFLVQCLGPLVVAASAAIVCWAWGTSYSSPIGDLFRTAPGWVTLGAMGAVIHATGWLLAARSVSRAGSPERVTWWHIVPILFVGVGVGVIASQLARLAPPLWELTPAARDSYVWLSVPALLAVVLVLSHLYVGYTSTWRSDAEREWSARFTGWVLIAVTVWFAGFGLVIGGPAILAWIASEWILAHAALLVWLASALAGMSGVGAAMAAKSPTTAAAAPVWPAEIRSKLALGLAAVFIAWLVVVLSWLGGQAMQLIQARFARSGGSTALLLAAIGCTSALWLFGVITGRLIDTNMFSLHAMYRARLIRAYLGASRPDGEREPNRFTGFDDGDNQHLRDLWPQPADDGGNQRPLHVINAALNLVSGSNLAWQERKAESFTFSPLHAGSPNVGYRATQADPRDPASGGYGGDRGVSLGTAMAISGAAASPDMGYHSSPVLSLLLTFFNVRLGWWLGNPGHAGRRVYQRSNPRSSLQPIVDEALGNTDDRNSYVYLSDGGHFENLGMYQMVLRRCHIIVVSDASRDAVGGCVDLGNAIRKIRVDLGIPIDIDITPIADRGAAAAVGSIRYNCVDRGAPDGILVYLKPALAASDPADVLAYARANPDFPHQATAEQWFTESQFESYRHLGSRLVEELAGPPPDDGATMSWFAEQVRGHLNR
ncbi:MAG: patatin-like phospholipase family protein [Gemmatimonadales bacterium]